LKDKGVVNLIDAIPPKKVQQFHELYAAVGAVGFFTPPCHTFATVESVGRPVTLGDLVNTHSPPTMLYSAAGAFLERGCKLCYDNVEP
jgi:hypothetical protein